MPGTLALPRPSSLSVKRYSLRDRVEHLHLDGVELVEAPDGGEHQRPDAGAESATSRPSASSTPSTSVVPELAQHVEHPDARQHREPLRLLERGDEHAREAVQLGLAGLVREVGHRHRHRRRPPAARAGARRAGERRADREQRRGSAARAPRPRRRPPAARAAAGPGPRGPTASAPAPAGTPRAPPSTSAPSRGRAHRVLLQHAARRAAPSAGASGTSSAGAGRGAGRPPCRRPPPGRAASPASIRWSITPSAKTSVRSSSGAPRHCSGAM